MNHSSTITADARTVTDRPSVRGRLGVALLAAALLSATACGSDAASPTTSSTTTTAPTSTTTSTAPTTTPTTTPTSTTTDAPRPTAIVDERVGDDGEQVHVRCVGEGDTTVLLIAGFVGDTSSWAEVESPLASHARVCSSDRPGTGTSDPATATATFDTQATDLHALLRTIGEPGPYVVVGHSFGGAEAVTFASRYADEVTGLVLVDASHTTWPTALCAVADDGSDAAAIIRATCTESFPPSGNSEHLDVFAAFAEASGIASLGSLPMAVITAVDRWLPAGLAAPEVERLTEAWNQGQHHWMELSTAAHLVSVDDTGHQIAIDQPDVVIDEILRQLP